MSLPTNMFVIPWVSILVIPPLLVIQMMIPVFPSLAVLGIQLVEFTLGIAWQVIEFAASFDLVYYRSPLNLPVLVISLVGVMSLLAPRGLFPRWVSLFCLLPLFNFIPTEIKPLQITFLDVGQGLSVLVQTPGQVILYDTGPAFRSGFNAGEQIVAPYLRSRGIKEIDHLIVSHSDNDHSGGFSAIIRNLQVDKAYASDQDFLPDTVSCVTPSTWKADELVFSIFAINEPADANNQSCLLQITGQGIAVMLTGDIESQAESILVASDLPTMDLISVPHHGSATSSTPGFLNKLRPVWSWYLPESTTDLTIQTQRLYSDTGYVMPESSTPQQLAQCWSGLIREGTWKSLWREISIRDYGHSPWSQDPVTGTSTREIPDTIQKPIIFLRGADGDTQLIFQCFVVEISYKNTAIPQKLITVFGISIRECYQQEICFAVTYTKSHRPDHPGNPDTFIANEIPGMSGMSSMAQCSTGYFLTQPIQIVAVSGFLNHWPDELFPAYAISQPKSGKGVALA